MTPNKKLAREIVSTWTREDMFGDTSHHCPQDFPKLEAHIVDALQAKDKAMAEIVEALEWYSKRENWKLVDFFGEIKERIDPSDLNGEGYMCCSGGKRARAALAKLRGETV